MNLDKYNLQIGHIVRHAPTNPGSQGFEAAVIDVAQDLLFMYLDSKEMFKDVALKGGTAIRKLYAGKQGRFSIDLDFSTADTLSDVNEIAFKVVECIDGAKIGDFNYSATERRNRWYVGFECPFIDDQILKTKLDFSAPGWIDSKFVFPVDMPVHKQYGHNMPPINTVRLEENMAEKIARLNRTSTSRDIYDLNWIMNNYQVRKDLDLDLVRLLVVLKIWVDANGLHCDNVEWKTAHKPTSFDPDYWLRDREVSEVDLEDIGALSVPAPKIEEMLLSLKSNFEFLHDLNDTEKVIAMSNAKDRGLVINTLKNLPDGIFANKVIY